MSDRTEVTSAENPLRDRSTRTPGGDFLTSAGEIGYALGMLVSAKTPALLTLAIVLISGGLLYAQMGPNDSRLIPYQGTLYEGGTPANGEHDFRFALFSVEPTNAELDCLLTEPPNCALWAEEQTSVQVESGTFSVALGAEEPVTDTMLAQSALFVGVAVKASTAAGFHRLGGASRILPAAWASRAAAAADFSVSGTVTATTITATGGVSGRTVTAIAANQNQAPLTFVGRTEDGSKQILITTDEVEVLNTDLILSAPAGRSVISNNTVRSRGGVSAAGRILSDCPGGMTRVRPASAVCIDNETTQRGQIDAYDAAAFCHNTGKRLCSISEASVATRTGTTAQYNHGVIDVWAWVEGSGTASGFDYGACHVNMNFNQVGAIHGEANCQIPADAINGNIGVVCCYEQ